MSFSTERVEIERAKQILRMEWNTRELAIALGANYRKASRCVREWLYRGFIKKSQPKTGGLQHFRFTT